MAGERVVCDGNEAAGWGCLLSDCRCFFGYPITPASEVGHFLARELPKVGGLFLQTEGEAAAAYMVFSAQMAGARAMTATSGPGFSLMQEAISYMATVDSPAVIVHVMRMGPGGGNSQQAQADYRQVTSGGGHGGYRTIVLAPSSNQEIVDLVQTAFYLADRYRIAVIVLTDFLLARTAECVELRKLPFEALPPKEWALRGKASRGGKSVQQVTGLFLRNVTDYWRDTMAKYSEIDERETRFEKYCADDAELLVLAYGSTARACKQAVEWAREKGYKVGLLRPITLWPFPSKEIQRAATGAKRVLVVEDSPPQFLNDVELALHGQKEIHHVNILFRHRPDGSGLLLPEVLLEEMINLVDMGQLTRIA